MRRLLTAALLVAFAGAGCEDGDTLSLDDGRVALTVSDYRYDHQRVSVPAGEVVIDLTNAGTEPTNFRIRRRQRDLVSIATLEPGERGYARVRLRPGETGMYSGGGRQGTLGEHGRLTVRD